MPRKTLSWLDAPGLLWFLVVLCLLVRVVHLDADAYPRLSWSSALLTDEGFYIHDARTAILVGRSPSPEQTRLVGQDEFHNALIMPLLHGVQWLVFRAVGVSAMSARSISIVFSLATLWLLWSALHQAAGQRAALYGLLFLGLDHANFLYNRLALMDTPGVFWIVAAFYCLVRGLQSYSPPSPFPPFTRNTSHSVLRWLIGAGLLLAGGYATRGLCLLVLPTTLWAIWRTRSGHQKLSLAAVGSSNIRRSLPLRGIIGVLAGLGAGLLLYVVLWYAPHHAELARVNRYYVGIQLLPHSLHGLYTNVKTGCFDWQRGWLPYLLRHQPIQCLLCASLAWSRAKRTPTLNPTGREEPAIVTAFLLPFLGGWLLTLALFLSVVNYAPSRYYVLLYPALAGLAALRLSQLNAAPELGTSSTNAASRNLPLPLLPLLAMAAWLAINGAWSADWLTHLTYRQRDADRWLAANLPTNAVVFGAIAPGLCLNNRLLAVNVMEGFCNDDQPLERFHRTAPAVPQYVLILDQGGWREHWWQRTYPDVVSPGHRLRTFPHVLRPFFTAGLYPVRFGSTRKLRGEARIGACVCYSIRYDAGGRVYADARSDDWPGRHTARRPGFDGFVPDSVSPSH